MSKKKLLMSRENPKFYEKAVLRKSTAILPVCESDNIGNPGDGVGFILATQSYYRNFLLFIIS
jgi:hypothetical protein